MGRPVSIRRIALLLGIVLLIAVAALQPLVFRRHLYECLIFTLLAGVYVLLWRRNALERVSFLAIVSLTTGLLNPGGITFLVMVLQLDFWVSGWSFGSFFWGVFALFTGFLSLRRMRRSTQRVWGRWAAWTGLVIGSLWVLGWFVGYLILVNALSGMTG